MAEKIFLTPADRDLLREVVNEVVSSRINTPSRSEQNQRWGAPETYLAYVPTGGIDAATSDDPTGTGTDPQDGVPGSRECEIYGIRGYGTSAAFEEIPGLSRMVYNPFPLLITGDQWVPVTRTKGGSWIVTGTNGAGGSGETSMTIGPVHLVDSNGTGSGTGSWYAQRVERSGAGWIVSPGPVDYSDVIEINGLPPRYLDTDATPGAAALAVTTLFRDINGAYYVDYPYLSDSASDSFSTPLTWTGICNADGTITISPSTYQNVTITSAWDNFTDFPRINVQLEVS